MGNEEKEDNKRVIKTSKFVVESKDDLDVRVNRSSFCKISFSPIDIEIEPSKNSKPFITNIEGLLNRLEKVLSYIESSEEKKEILEYLKDVRSGDKDLVVELKDPTGESYIGEKNG